MAKTFVMDRINAILKTNADGSKQFGLRDQHQAISKKLGSEAAQSWLARHMEVTSQFRELFEPAQARSWLGADSEATGVGDNAQACELGIVWPDGEIAYSTFLRPQISIESGAVGVHNITDEMVSEAPTISGEHARIQELLDSVDAIFWYNGSYDIRIMRQSCFAYDVAPFNWPNIVDVMSLLSDWIGDWNGKQHGWKWHKLEGGHRAVGDARMMLEAMKIASTSNIEYAKTL